jgi:hypothetical protein
MALDQTKMGRVVAEQMEVLEANHDEDCEIGDVCAIVEVLGPHGSAVRVRGSDMRPHIMIGLLRMSESIFLSSVSGADTGEAEDQ